MYSDTTCSDKWIETREEITKEILIKDFSCWTNSCALETKVYREVFRSSLYVGVDSVDLKKTRSGWTRVSCVSFRFCFVEMVKLHTSHGKVITQYKSKKLKRT